jgi:hypothetical protein
VCVSILHPFLRVPITYWGNRIGGVMVRVLNSSIHKGINKMTELRTILQRESKNAYLYKQTKSVNNENCENRNDPDLVQAFLKKW